MLPVAGAGDFLGQQLPAGAGDYLTPTPRIGTGAGGELPYFFISTVSNVLIRQVGCRIINIEPSDSFADRSFIIENSGDFCHVTPLTPGCNYVVSLQLFDEETGFLGRSLTGVLPVPAEVLDASGAIVASKMLRPAFILESLTLAVGKMFQAAGGRPTARVMEDLSIGQTLLLVNSTLGFPRSGVLSLGERKLAYTDKCDTAFLLAEPASELVLLNAVLFSDAKAYGRR